MKNTKRGTGQALRRAGAAVATAIFAITLGGAGARAQEATVAVVDFGTAQLAGRWSYQWDREQVGALAARVLSDRLDAVDGLSVIDPQSVAEAVQATGVGAGLSLDADSARRLGRRLNSQLIVMGEVVEFSHSTKERSARDLLARTDEFLQDAPKVQRKIWKWKSKIFRHGDKLKLSKATVATRLHVKVMNAGTGDVVGDFAAEGEVKFGGGKIGPFKLGGGFNADQVVEILSSAASDIAADLSRTDAVLSPVTLCRTGTVVSPRGSDVYLNLGEEAGVRTGDSYEIYRTVGTFTDPATGEILGVDEENVGRVEIIEVKSERLSAARTLEGSGFDRGDRAVEFGRSGQALACEIPSGSAPAVAVSAQAERQVTSAAAASPPAPSPAFAPQPTVARPISSPAPDARPSARHAVITNSGVVGVWTVDMEATHRRLLDMATETNPELAAVIQASPDRFTYDPDRLEMSPFSIRINADRTCALELGFDGPQGEPVVLYGSWINDGDHIRLDLTTSSGIGPAGSPTGGIYQYFEYANDKLYGVLVSAQTSQPVPVGYVLSRS